MMSSELSIKLKTSDDSAEGQTDHVTCRLCRRQFSKYTCPTCNVPYCSLTCFRSPAHNQCSEGFYKKEIETDIHAGPSKTVAERQRMMDLLRKFEEESANDQTQLSAEDAEDEDPSGLARRFASVDLDSTSGDVVWSMLTPEERKKFMKALDDPTSELAQELLASEELEKEIQEPWWQVVEDNELPPRDAPRRHGSRPTMMKLPSSMIKPVPSGHPLVYNICAICIAYAYVTRHLATSPLCRLGIEDPDHHAAQRLFSQLVPFLTDRKSTKLYPNVPALITDIWSFFELGEMSNSLFRLLLKDASTLLKPSRVTEISAGPTSGTDVDLSSHPHHSLMLVVSDLHAMFTQNGKRHAAHKLLFYAAHIVATPTMILDMLAKEVMDRAEGYQDREAEHVEFQKMPRDAKRALVEEI